MPVMDKEKFLERLIPVTETGCWLWEGPGTRYGLCYTGNKSYSKGQETTHRVAYKLFKGPIPEGQVVMHRCDVPLCCNPDHLRLGTFSENVIDAIEKGRIAYKTKFSEETVEEMRKMRKQGAQVKEIAALFGVDRGYCSRLVKGCQPKGVINCHG